MKQRIVKIANEHTDKVVIEYENKSIMSSIPITIHFYANSPYYLVISLCLSKEMAEHIVKTLPDEIINDLVNQIVGEK